MYTLCAKQKGCEWIAVRRFFDMEEAAAMMKEYQMAYTDCMWKVVKS